MLVAINSCWKVPVGYFLINGILSQEKSNLVNICLSNVHEVGVTVKTLTFDGTSANFSMARCLGANLSFPNLVTFFPHPETKEKVHILLDAAHMIKLCRNTLSDLKVLYDKNDNAIQWKYFEQLVNYQNDIGLHARTKISQIHINIHKEKMKIRLAAQTFSMSVANALTFFSTSLNLKQFKQSESTIEFCKNINIFDFLSTRNFLSKSQYQKPLKHCNEGNNKLFIKESIEYLQISKCENQNKEKILILKITQKN